MFFVADLVKPLSYAHQRYLTELLYGRGTCSRDLCSPCGTFVPCDVPWRDVMENVRIFNRFLRSRSFDVIICQNLLCRKSTGGGSFLNRLKKEKSKREVLKSSVFFWRYVSRLLLLTVLMILSLVYRE